MNRFPNLGAQYQTLVKNLVELYTSKGVVVILGKTLYQIASNRVEVAINGIILGMKLLSKVSRKV